MFIFIVVPIVMFTRSAYSAMESAPAEVQLVLTNPSSTAITMEMYTRDDTATGNWFLFILKHIWQVILHNYDKTFEGKNFCGCHRLIIMKTSLPWWNNQITQDTAPPCFLGTLLYDSYKKRCIMGILLHIGISVLASESLGSFFF